MATSIVNTDCTVDASGSRQMTMSARRGEAFPRSTHGFATRPAPAEPLTTITVTGMPRPYTRRPAIATSINNTNPAYRDRQHRRSIRLRGYDYTESGVYSVTVCTDQRRSLFGRVVNGEMHLNSLGRIIDTHWHRLTDQADSVALDAFVIMPNHLHAILILTRETRSVRDAAPSSPRLPSRSLGAIVGNLKSVIARRINQVRDTPGARVWQRNYYEHIVRDEGELARIRAYIAQNPARWAEDCYYEVEATRLREV